MIERFQGTSGERLLRDAMLAQQCVCHRDLVADALCAVAELVELKEGEVLVREGAEDNDIYLIISGSVSVRVHEREMAIRRSEQHVGEIAMIDRADTRTATLVAAETTVVAKVSEQHFTAIADEHPFMWRCLANELGRRLRERAKHVEPPNPRPVIFIGSSSEGLEIAKAVEAGIADDDCIVYLWTENVFTAGTGTMERLEELVRSIDFGVLVCTRDDRIVNDERGVNMHAPRDNVILELGMCLGRLGRKRALIVKSRIRDLKIPSDLLGITTLDFEDDGDTKTLATRLGDVCTQIRNSIRDLGPK